MIIKILKKEILFKQICLDKVFFVAKMNHNKYEQKFEKFLLKVLTIKKNRYIIFLQKRTKVHKVGGNKMVKFLNKKTYIEKELCGTTKIFGEDYEIQVIYKKINMPELDLYNHTITIFLPNKYRRNKNTQILKLALEKMYDEIARIEIENAMEQTRIMLNGLAPENYVIKRIPNKLAKTLQNKIIVINPDIVKYNKQILKYVVLHEFCHLKYKTHSKKFWEMLEKYMPYYEEYEYIKEVA